eukprot:COSAG01_NODE_3457_length_6072_cov_14.110330_3_plen_233_part_00
MSNWDGGVRANAFVSGGFLPHKVRGTKYAGLIAIWDWYSTLCAFGGVVATDARAAAASLPPLDSLSMHEVLLGAVHDPTAFHWPCMRRAKRPTTTARQTHNIHHTDRQTDRQAGRQTDTCALLCTWGYWCFVHAGTGQSPRRHLALGTEPRLGSLWGVGGTSVNGLIEQDEKGKLWKLLTGPIWEAGWTGQTYPNRTTDTSCFDHPKGPVTSPGSCIHDCGNGTCLFELREV